MKKTSLEKIKFKARFEYFRSIIFSEEALHQKGAIFEVVKFPPKIKNQKHQHHSTLEIFYIKSGKGIIAVGEKKYNVKEDNILLIPPKSKHQVINNSKKDLIILIFKTNSFENDLYF